MQQRPYGFFGLFFLKYFKIAEFWHVTFVLVDKNHSNIELT